MRHVTLKQRLRYAFDNMMARGTPALIGLLALASLAMIGLVTLVVLIASLSPPNDDGEDYGFIELGYRTLLRTLDPGTIGGDDGSWQFLVAMLAVTFGGIFLVSTLIGILTTGINSKVDELRKGRSRVIETDHTLVLGWSEEVFTILTELAVANASRKRPAVVVLAPVDKVEMEDSIRAKVGDALGTTRVVCRTGSPMNQRDLDLVNPYRARAIIVLAPPEQDPDTQVIKTLLALTNDPSKPEGAYHIVAEIQDPDNLEAARLAGGDEVQLIDVGDTISRLIAQTSRQSGLSVVYTELLDFKGDEVYFHHNRAIENTAFGNALHAYDTCSVMGLVQFGRVTLNPPMDTLIQPGDSVVAIAEDDAALTGAVGSPAPIDEDAIKKVKDVELRPVLAQSFGCPCHGGQYNAEGNRTAGPPVRSLDRYSFSIRNGKLILGENVYGNEGVIAGAIMVALLALAFEFGLAGIQRLLTPRGLELQRQSAQATA